MIIGIVGSRRYRDELSVRELVRELHMQYGEQLVIVSGGCSGVDSWAEDEARKLGMKDENIKIFKPNLDGCRDYYEVVLRYYARNRQIAECAVDGIYAFVAANRTGGTENTIKYAKELGRKVIIK